jgi:hypothetical protein
LTAMVKVRNPQPKPEPKAHVRRKCTAKGFCDGLLHVCGLGKQQNSRGGLEISLSFGAAPGKPRKLKFRERAIVRQDGYKPVIVIDYCPFCGAKYGR